jgi:hypothetical protein
VTITADTDVTNISAVAIGPFGTFAAAGLDLEPNDPMVLGVGDALTMETPTNFFRGMSVNGPLLSKATTDAEGKGIVTVENNSGSNAKIVFELSYTLSGTATIDNAAFDAAFLTILLAISTPSAPLVSEALTIELPAGGLSGGDTLSDSFQFTLAVDAGAVDAISLSTTLSGSATTQAMAPVPLPAALPLFAAGLAAVGLAARRRNRR